MGGRWEVGEHLHPAEGPGSLAIGDGEMHVGDAPAATQGAPFVRGAVWSLAGNRKMNMSSSPNSEEGDPEGKVSLAGRLPCAFSPKSTK